MRSWRTSSDNDGRMLTLMCGALLTWDGTSSIRLSILWLGCVSVSTSCPKRACDCETIAKATPSDKKSLVAISVPNETFGLMIECHTSLCSLCAYSALKPLCGLQLDSARANSTRQLSACSFRVKWFTGECKREERCAEVQVLFPTNLSTEIFMCVFK